MHLYVVIWLNVELLCVLSSVPDLAKAFRLDRTSSVAGLLRSATTLDSASQNPVTYRFGDDVKLKRDVALRLNRHARITSHSVSEDITYICRGLCR